MMWNEREGKTEIELDRLLLIIGELFTKNSLLVSENNRLRQIKAELDKQLGVISSLQKRIADLEEQNHKVALERDNLMGLLDKLENGKHDKDYERSRRKPSYFGCGRAWIYD